MDPEEGQRLYFTAKRTVEIILSLAGCLLLLPLIPPLLIWNTVTGSGGVFFRQERVGHLGRPFVLYKFRTMSRGEGSRCETAWARPSPERMTFPGRWLRRLRLDEFPQFFNILKGEMSLIGPRPELPALVDRLVRADPSFRLRQAAKPGITGWAQVQYRYCASVPESLEKLSYDLFYLKHRGPRLDMRILAKTVLVMVRLDGT